jgi:hypothetical protein
MVKHQETQNNITYVGVGGGLMRSFEFEQMALAWKLISGTRKSYIGATIMAKREIHATDIRPSSTQLSKARFAKTVIGIE